MPSLNTSLKPDPGWLFIIPGLALCAATILIPAHMDLQTLHSQYSDLRQDESHTLSRLAARANFIDQLESQNPRLLAHLASNQLNLMPASDTAVLVDTAGTANVLAWIDSTLPSPNPSPDRPAQSRLARWATGPHRLWLFAAGVMAIFIGLFMEPVAAYRRHCSLILADPTEEAHPIDMYETQILARSQAVDCALSNSFPETLF